MVTPLLKYPQTKTCFTIGCIHELEAHLQRIVNDLNVCGDVITDYRLHQITSQKSGEVHGCSGSSLISEIVPFLEATSPSSPHRSSAGRAWAAEAAQRSKGSLPRCTRRKEPRSTCGQAMFGTHLFMYKSNLYLYTVYIYIICVYIYNYNNINNNNNMIDIPAQQDLFLLPLLVPVVHFPR